MMIEPNETRTRLTRFTFAEPLDNCPVGRLELAFHKICAVAELEKSVSKAVKDGNLQSLTMLDKITEANEMGLLNADQTSALMEAEIARQEVIAVDDFSDDELRRAPVKNSESSKSSKKSIPSERASIETIS
jgi:acyl-CoA dehydrogenase